MKHWRALAGAVALVAALVFLALRSPDAPARPTPQPSLATKAPMVQIIAGQIEAQHTVSVETAKSMPIDEFLADVGQDVTEGQAIARLATSLSADTTAAAALNAETKTIAAKSAAEEARLEAVKAKADAQRAKEKAAQAREVFERERKLMEVGATPRQTMERAQRESQGAEADWSAVEEIWRLADNRMYAALGEAREAAAAAETAKKDDVQTRTRIAAAELHAPASGMVIWRKGAEESKEIFRIAVDLDRLRAVFPAGNLKTGQAILITVPGAVVPPIHASVSSIESAQAIADFTSPAPAIRPGAQCTVSVQLK